MKKHIKFFAVFLVLLEVIFFSSCARNTSEQDKEIYSDENHKQEEEENISLNKFDTIANTHVSLDQIGPRLIGTNGNHVFVKELRDYLKGFYEAEFVSMPYSINLYDKYSVTVEVGTETITFDSNNSICKFINDSKFNENVVITDKLDNLDRLTTYIFVTDKEKLIEKSKEYNNICLSVLAINKVYLGQNAIKVKTNIPTIMSINNDTAAELLQHQGEEAKLGIKAETKEINLENVYAVIKGKDGSDAIVITSHVDSTTALGNNYSKGAIDNGTGVSLNLDLLRKFYENKNEWNYDIIFAFVNSEEGFLTKSLSGSMQLSASLSLKYKNIININLDCLGEKGVDLFSYGYDGNINGNKLREIMNKQDIGNFNLEPVDYYTSDNLSFKDTIYFYNFDYHGDNRAIHTEYDMMDAVDIEGLENISDILFNILTEILETGILGTNL